MYSILHILSSWYDLKLPCVEHFSTRRMHFASDSKLHLKLASLFFSVVELNTFAFKSYEEFDYAWLAWH